MELQSFMSGIALAKSAVELVSSSVELITDPAKREAAKAALDQSKKAFAIAEVQAAQQLGYPLCKCEFPPVICTQRRANQFLCPKCNADNTPPPESIGGGSWS